MRAQTWQQDIEQYDVRFATTPLYAQLDTERHVNNLGVLNLYVEARLRLRMALLGEQSWFSDGLLLRPRRTITQFIGQAHYLHQLEAAVRVIEVQDDCYRLALAVFQDGECIGVQDCLMGAWQDGGWVALPEDLGTALRTRLDTPADLTPFPPTDEQTIHDWPCHSDFTARYADMDPDGCFGELSLARCFEQSRANPVGRVRPSWVGLMVVRLDQTFHRWDKGNEEMADMALPSGIARIGNTSFVVRGEVQMSGDRVATGESVLVMVDPKTGRPWAPSEEVRERMQGIAVAGAAT